MKIAVIIPAYNEEKEILNTLQGVQDIDYDIDIFVVDDGSKDNTVTLVENINKVLLLSYGQNKGKGYALNFGLSKVIDDYDIIGFLDGDLGICSNEASKLIEPIISRNIDVTIAQFPSAKKKGGFGFVKRLAYNGIKFYTGKEIYSGLSGQRFFKAKVLKSLKEIPFGYGVEVGMTIDILRLGYNILEVPVIMTHNETGRDINGFNHRFKQYYHIIIILIKKLFRWFKLILLITTIWRE